jgi:hypothetical protein
MRRLLAVALCGSALALTGVASAAAPSQHAWTMGLFALGGGSSATSGIVRDAPEYGGISIGPVCCEVTILFERHFNADVMRGAIDGRIVVGGNPDGTVWEGTLHGSIDPAGSSGHLSLVEDTTGRRFSGTWTWVGHPDQSVPHVISIPVDGMLYG